MTIKVASWNVNSVRAREETVLRWIKMASPDVLLLQEIKCLNEAFPREPFEDLGYNIALNGQKTYNGVAILSKSPLEDVHVSFPQDPLPDQARYMEAVTFGCRVASVYVPNGQSLGSEAFAYKLHFLKALRAHMTETLRYGEKVIWGGDYNIAPHPIDLYDEARGDEILCSAQERASFYALLHLGMTNALRALNPSQRNLYSWWDYRKGAWEKNHGFLIDHLLLSPQAADHLVEAHIDQEPRGWEKASDHAPLWCRIKP